ncbi:MAG: FAD-dependent oxidoreductase, partial [Myxococcota bacterium]
MSFARKTFWTASLAALFGMQGCAFGVDGVDSEDQDRQSSAVTSLDCDVVVAGGTTAALATALTSAREGVKTCLLEPTDWPGGQLTAGGVPAVDFAWHKIGNYNVGAVAKDPRNLPTEFVQWMDATGNPGGCWVSKNCYEPKNLLAQHILPALSRESGNLTVLLNTVVKRVSTEDDGGHRRIRSVMAIQREARPGVAWGGYDRRLSEDMADWYTETDSARYTKTTVRITSNRAGGPVVVDATELGDVLVLSHASYLQGVEKADGSLETDDETCGQAVVFPFVMRYNNGPVADNALPVQPDHPEFYGVGNSNWDKIWTYRRVKGSGGVAAGQLSNQNWNPGNDYAYGYLFKSKAEAAAERSDWRGGVNYDVLEAAERHAIGWYRWLREREPRGRGDHLSMAADVFGTAHGLSKFPYLRDTRRSVGIGDFVISAEDLTSSSNGKTAIVYEDRVAIGLYNGDIHPLRTCDYPAYLYHEVDAMPFFIPLRALTNKSVDNLLVAGKTMAQSFQANAAIRLHPIEYSSGIGAGAAAATMVLQNIDDTQTLLGRYADVQARVTRYAPIDWTVNGTQYPRPGEAMDPVPGGGEEGALFCPPGS